VQRKRFFALPLPLFTRAGLDTVFGEGRARRCEPLKIYSVISTACSLSHRGRCFGGALAGGPFSRLAQLFRPRNALSKAILTQQFGSMNSDFQNPFLASARPAPLRFGQPRPKG
jgi:hypothetical protein